MIDMWIWKCAPFSRVYEGRVYTSNTANHHALMQDSKDKKSRTALKYFMSMT